MYDKIILMLPTYKRIDKLEKFINSAYGTCENPANVFLRLCVNTADDITRAWVSQNKIPFQYDVIDETTQQPNLPVYYNSMFAAIKLEEHDRTVASMVGDDMVFITPGWDKIILDKINEKNGEVIVYGDDDYIGHEKLMVYFFVPCKIINGIKKPFMCPMFHADMVDVIWTNIGLLTQTACYLPDLHIKHEHESAKGKPENFDATFKRMMPLRVIANEKENRMYAWRYANICAANLIDSGIGRWNIL